MDGCRQAPGSQVASIPKLPPSRSFPPCALRVGGFLSVLSQKTVQNGTEGDKVHLGLVA